MKKTNAFSLLIASILLILSSLFAEEGGVSRLYPLPMIEVERVVMDWLIHSGFEVSKIPIEGDQILLLGKKESEKWELILKPHSPLASILQIKYTVSGGPHREKLQELWSHLERYSHGPPIEQETLAQEIPSKVSSQSASVVCIKAKLDQGEIQFSGFVIDPQGFIISTAHDLKSPQEILVTLHDGQRFKGEIVKNDSHRDLVLIHIRSALHSFIPIKGKRFLKDGEKVYMIGYPNGHQGVIHSGLIDGPLRWVGPLPLWKVKMETLPGSSGSPVFDAKGNLVAMVKGRLRGSDTVGFLIPLETILEFLKEK